MRKHGRGNAGGKIGRTVSPSGRAGCSLVQWILLPTEWTCHPELDSLDQLTTKLLLPNRSAGRPHYGRVININKSRWAIFSPTRLDTSPFAILPPPLHPPPTACSPRPRCYYSTEVSLEFARRHQRKQHCRTRKSSVRVRAGLY